MKLNTDGSHNPSSLSMGTGGLIRNDQAGWLMGFSSHGGVGDVLLAELLAIKNGLRIAWENGFRAVLCESDSLEAVSMISDNSKHDFHEYAATLCDIMVLLRYQWSVQIKHVFREANTCADFLAKLEVNQNSVWKFWKDPPALMGSLLLKDSLRMSFFH